MGCRWNPVLLLIISAVIYTVQATTCSSNYSYDITQTLRGCIVNLFHNAESDSVEKLLNNLENYKNKEFEFEVAHEKDPFHNKLFFSSINITGSRRVRDAETPHVIVHCEFPNKKINLSCPKFVILFTTCVGATKGSIYSRFYPDLCFRNMSITVTKLPNSGNNVTKFNLTFFNEKLTYSYNKQIWFCQNLTSNRKKELEDEFKKAMIPLFLNNINDNEKFFQDLDENFLTRPEKDIISAHAKFLGHEQQHYYFIPNISLYWFNLRDVTIVGLSNFQSLSFTGLICNSTNTLVVKDVRGSMTLDYGCEIQKPLALNFISKWVHISYDYAINEVNVEAKDYHVSRTVDNARVDSRHAAVIMGKIECAVASSIFPEMRFWKNSNQSTSKYDKECPLEKFFTETTGRPETKSIKQFFSQWIPFIDK